MTHNIYTYDAISEFNRQYYSDLLVEANIIGTEVSIGTAKEKVDGLMMEIELNNYFYPVKKNRVVYMVPSNFIPMMPIVPTEVRKISYQSKGYNIVTDYIPKGFGASMEFDSFREFIDSFCDYKHTSPDDFTLWKIISVLSYVSRINVRVASAPAFGKDSVIKVMHGLLGNIGIVHNPSAAKLEYLLPNSIIMTNEVAGIKSDERSNLENYYLMCGDFSPSYEKRSVANFKGAKDTYNISNLSNVVCYNDLSCYPESSQKKYFDNVFQRAVKERFFSFRFKGRIDETFTHIGNVSTFVRENESMFKKVIKTFKWLTENINKHKPRYVLKDYGFTDRPLRNWTTICQLGLDLYCESQEEFDRMVELLYDRHLYYQVMFDKDTSKQEKLESVI